MVPLKTQAVQTALHGDWKAAVILNQMLLEEDPNDIDALNRLAFAKTSLGEIKEAKAIYQKVLSLDTTNPIATKNLERLSGEVVHSGDSIQHIQVSNVFIEEPGKTKVVELINTADKKILTPLRNGEQLLLSIKRMKIFLYDAQRQYIGMLPHDIGNRLIKLIEGGNRYDSYVKTVQNTHVLILVKEVRRALRFKNQPSFISLEKTKFLLDGNLSEKNRKGNKFDRAYPDSSYYSDDSNDKESS